LEGEGSLTARLAATDGESLDRLAGYVHDAWFDVDQISRKGDVVTIPIALRGMRVKRRFLPAYTKPPGSYESLITIRGVGAFEVDEPEQISVYGINRLSFAPPRLELTAGPSCTVTFEVSELDVECELRTTEYDWDAAGATALVVPFRAAEPVIGEHRRNYTASGREGMSAHLTLLVPFVHADRLEGHDRHRLRETIRRFPACDVRLGTFGVFENIGCLYLAPFPRDPFVALSEALMAEYPEIDYPPEGLDIVPHVTIGSRLTKEEQGAIKRDVAPLLPIRTRADRVVLVERGEDGRWFDRETFLL
jgi:2'-5' RNA ligase